MLQPAALQLLRGDWVIYRDREPVGQVRVVGSRVFGSRRDLTLAVPVAQDLAVSDELSRGLRSRRRLHDLWHGSASIMLAEGADIAIVSKRLRHSGIAITVKNYAHLLRSTGHSAAATIAAAIPHTAPRVQRVCSDQDMDTNRAADVESTLVSGPLAIYQR
jgi:hypothetical protein